MGNDLLAATRVQIGEGVDAAGATPPEIRRRYIENRNWRRYPKEYIYLLRVRYFRLFERLERIMPGLVHPLAAVDEFLLSALPVLHRYSGTALIEGVVA